MFTKSEINVIFIITIIIKIMWRLSRWSKLRAGKSQASPHIPPLRRTDRDNTSNDNILKAQILAEKFFPEGGQADLSDIDGENACKPHA